MYKKYILLFALLCSPVQANLSQIRADCIETMVYQSIIMCGHAGEKLECVMEAVSPVYNLHYQTLIKGDYINSFWQYYPAAFCGKF